jgi:hypothetical protein
VKIIDLLSEAGATSVFAVSFPLNYVSTEGKRLVCINAVCSREFAATLQLRCGNAAATLRLLRREVPPFPSEVKKVHFNHSASCFYLDCLAQNQQQQHAHALS